MSIITYDEYTCYADGLERDLVDLYGVEKAARLFQKMTADEFSTVLERATSESLVRQWLERLKEKTT